MKFLIFNFQFSIILLVLSFLVFPTVANAQEFSLGIYPPIIQVDAQPPAVVRVPIILQNQSESPVSLHFVLRPFKPSDKENGEIEYIDKTSDYDRIFEKLQIRDGDISKKQFNLAAKQKKDLVLTLTLPKQLSTSDYYFSIIFISEGSDTKDLNRSTSVGGIAMNVLLATGEKKMPTGSILDFKAPLFVTKGPVPFKVRVQNENNHYITTEGRVEIKNVFGQKIGRVDLLPLNVLAKARRFLTDKEGLSSLGIPQVVWPEKFLLGAYTADLTVSLSDQGPILKESITFFAFPIELILGLVVILVTIIFIYQRLKLKTNS